ncbi:MAG TPA: hypothetical protein VLI90_10665 [Tepidisphaeraceae bacterium]|nr:hypothetical protein [Tepidisphaeraceae bacterium]
MSDQSKAPTLGEQDMAMYAAIAGRPPQIDPNAADIMDAPEPRVMTRGWSPMVLSLYLRDVARQGALRLNRPEIAAWIRRQSDNAMKRLHESQTRIAHARNDRAA